jgi:hypothetical protein
MTSKIRSLRSSRNTALVPVEPASTGQGVTPPTAHAHPLAVFRRLAAVLDLTAEIAASAGQAERHADLSARLAILRARVAAGETTTRLVTTLAEFGQEFKSFIAHDLGFGRA